MHLRLIFRSFFMTIQPVSPPLRWPGGKRALLPQIKALMPRHYNCLHEPFIGGGALSFALQPQGGFISDLNSELINVYQQIKHRPDALIDALQGFENTKTGFYDLRAKDREPDFAASNPVWRAARYLFLNRTCFNGMMRVNAKGQLNCAYGTPVSDTRAFDPEPVIKAHHALRATRIESAPFEAVLKCAQEGDFVYFDPPYVSVKPSGDINYTAGGFTLNDQGRLANLCGKLTKRGVFWMLSNANAAFIRKLYWHCDMHVVTAPRCLSSKAFSRGHARELLVKNYT